MYLKIRVVAGVKTESVTRDKPDTLTVCVRPLAQQGEANKRMQELVGAYLGVPKGAVRLVSGHHQPSKIVSIEWLDLMRIKEV